MKGTLRRLQRGKAHTPGPRSFLAESAPTKESLKNQITSKARGDTVGSGHLRSSIASRYYQIADKLNQPQKAGAHFVL